ncbi:MAG: hypothetical protein C4547_11470 [Phycisphaerales bacterium]|nr:MAG: hypothetical protein C4547_11470 [Phycisphaerales bacterium]
MISAIRQTVTVQSAGSIEVHSPKLRAGATAEVIVLIEEADGLPAVSPIEALDALQASLQLTPAAAAEWAAATRAEREAIGERS